MTSATDIDGYKLSYTYLTTAEGMPNRISKVCEYDGTTAGGELTIASAWAKGKSVAMTTENGCIRSFAMRVQFYYTDGSAEAFKFDFNPHADNVWQYRSGVVVASKAYSKMEIQLFYDYNMNTVYFDGIQLYKEQFGKPDLLQSAEEDA